MASTINGTSTGSGGLITTGDDSGILNIQTNETTAIAIDDSQRVSFVAGTAALPAITTTGDTNTGIFFPAADTIGFAEGGAEVARFDSSGNLGVGTSSPTEKLHVAGALRVTGAQTNAGTGVYLDYGSGIGSVNVYGPDASTQGIWRVYTATSNGGTGSEKARIDSSGNLLVNTTSQTFNGRFCVNTALNGGSFQTTAGASSYSAIVGARSGNIGNVAEWWYSVSTQVGTISITSSTTAYNTSSDYRLKNTIFPMTGALAKVALLKPVTYKWNIDDSDGEGFIAHELAEVIPHAVTGEKDAVDEEGNPKYQGIDTSFLVATLTAAIQEQQAIIESLTQRITALEGA